MPPKITPDPPQPADDFFLSLSRRGLQIDPAGDWLWLPHPDKAKAKKGVRDRGDAGKENRKVSELTDKLKVTRGKGYYTILKQILAGCGQQIIADARIIAESGKLTPFDIGILANRYDLNYKATCEWLEENGVIPTGTHRELVRRGLKACEVLAAVREAKGNHQ